MKRHSCAMTSADNAGVEAPGHKHTEHKFSLAK